MKKTYIIGILLAVSVFLISNTVFVHHNIKLETMTGISKDMYTLQNYVQNGAITDFEKREVIRCIRPVIEGIFRLKYFNIFTIPKFVS